MPVHCCVLAAGGGLHYRLPAEFELPRSVRVCRLGEQTLFGHLRKQLGFSHVRWVVSGGDSLIQQIDDFFEVRR